MKRAVSVLISMLIIAGAITAAPVGVLAAKNRVSLKKKSATLMIRVKNGKTVRGTTKIKLNKLKGVKLKRVTFKSSNKKVAVVSAKGKVTAKSKGTAKITVRVRYNFKKKSHTKVCRFKVKVKDDRAVAPAPTRETSPIESTEPISADESVKALNDPPEISGKNDAFSDKAFLKKLSAFSNKLYSMSAKDEAENYSMSPVSIYMALAMLYSIGDEGVKSDIEKLAGMSDSDIAETGELFKSLVKKADVNGTTVNQLYLTNSIWLDNNIKTNEDVLKKLAEELYCQAFQAPFAEKNDVANNAVQEYVKRKTNGLIDRNFELDPFTVFALINTLYFKDIWSLEKEELSTGQRYFNASSGLKSCEFLTGEYIRGRAEENDVSYYFYTKTASGYKIKFILPKSGKTLKEAMSPENLDEVNLAAYNENGGDVGEHYTRCIFPSFKLENETPLKKIFESNNVLSHAFNSYLSPLTGSELCVSDIKHRTVIDVNKKGVEGAAVTIIAGKNAAFIRPETRIYHDFVLNRAFGFIITDPSDVILFEGQVTDPSPKTKAIAQGEPDFSLRFGVYGQSSFDSKTGELVKTKDVINRSPEEFRTLLALSDEQKAEIGKALDKLDITSYPDSFDPYSDGENSVRSSPSVTLVLRVGGKTVTCNDIAISGEGRTEKGRLFLETVGKIESILTSSAEWKALPDYEALYY